jgi:hypothetical protein
MKKLIVIFIFLIFTLANVSAFAQEAKVKSFPGDIFNRLSKWLSTTGKRPDGKHILSYGAKKSTLSPDEVKERRRNMGVVRGMKVYE